MSDENSETKIEKPASGSVEKKINNSIDYGEKRNDNAIMQGIAPKQPPRPKKED